MNRLFFAACVGGCLICAALATAQPPGPKKGAPKAPPRPPQPGKAAQPDPGLNRRTERTAPVAVGSPSNTNVIAGGGYYGGGYGGGGGTVAGNAAQGMASVVQAQGNYNLLTSQASINMKESDRLQMENDLQWTDTYFEMRQLNKSYRDAERGPKGTEADWVRYAQQAAPKRLTYRDIDPVSAKINWPLALREDDYTIERESLEKLFYDRLVKSGGIGLAAYHQIQELTAAMTAQLKTHIKEMDSNTYLNARNFLTSLAYEGSIPVN